MPTCVNKYNEDVIAYQVMLPDILGCAAIVINQKKTKYLEQE